MSKSMEITNLLVHISLLKQIIKNFEAMAKLSVRSVMLTDERLSPLPAEAGQATGKTL